jgi:heme-degrading monooxygenase HmoA
MILQFIRLKTNLAEQELLERAKSRASKFEAIPGLLQKYYVKMDDAGQYGGVYIWDSKESLNSFRKSDLAASIPEAYEITKAPDIEIFDILFQLRNAPVLKT